MNYPPLPEVSFFDAGPRQYTESHMRAYIDADRKTRATAEPVAWLVDTNQGYSQTPAWLVVKPGGNFWDDKWTRYALVRAPAASVAPEQANCPGCNGDGVIGSPGAPCPFCKTHALGQQYRALADFEQASTKPAEPSEREAFEAWWGPYKLYDSSEITAFDVWFAWQARAALKPSPEPAEAEPKCTSDPNTCEVPFCGRCWARPEQVGFKE